MASLYMIFVIFILFDYSFTYKLGDKKETLELPKEYHVRGESTDLITGIIKPFEAWYSKKINKSRIDFYGGMEKIYYITENDENIVKLFYIHPITTEEKLNEIWCEKFPLADDPPTVWPTDVNYDCTGEVLYNNRVVQVWKYSEVSEKDKNEDTLYVTTNDEAMYIPVWRETKSYKQWTGTLVVHTIVRYYDFKEPAIADLDVTIVSECDDAVIKTAPRMTSDLDEAFYSFQMEHGKKYKEHEHGMRKFIFERNLRQVIEHNKKNLSYRMTINEFSDRTKEELAYLKGTRPSDPLAFGSVPFPHSEEEVDQIAQSLPENFDLRVDGVISVVKNQASCGSCWSFATTAAVEGALALYNRDRLLDLSEQSLVDCSWGFYNAGCGGGFLDGTFKYVLKHGIPTESEYGLYLESGGYCKLENMTKIFRIKGFARVPPLSINAMKLVLYKYGPVTVTINSNSILSYASGIFYDPECNDSQINHAVTVVGYGVRDGTTYWIVKNSWGENWGQDGYILISALNNNCHILEQCYYPIV